MARNKHLTFWLSIFLGLGALPLSSQATPVFSSSVRILGGNAVTPNNYYLTDVVPGSYDYSGGLASRNGTISYTGLDGDNNNATMNLTYDAQAQASATGLKSSASASLTNAFYNASNSPFVMDSSFATDPNGIPSTFSVKSEARFSDTLTVVGAADLASLVVSISIDGTNIGRFSPDNYMGGAVAQVYQTGDSFGLLFNTGYSDTLASHNEVVSSSAYSVSGGQVNFGLMLDTFVDFSLDWFEFGGSAILSSLLEGTADFFNTVTIDEFSGYNASGQQVDLVSVTGSGGQQYNVTPLATGNVPEPASLALMSIGLAAFGIRRRARAANRKGSRIGSS